MSSEGFTSTYRKWGIIIGHSYLEERYFNNPIIYIYFSVHTHSVRSISQCWHRQDDDGQIWPARLYSELIIKYQSRLLLFFSISPYTVHLCMRKQAKMTFPVFSPKHFNNTVSFFHAEWTMNVVIKKKSASTKCVSEKWYFSANFNLLLGNVLLQALLLECNKSFAYFLLLPRVLQNPKPSQIVIVMSRV